jgi:soluble lytic murein transglycosylase-like protein
MIDHLAAVQARITEIQDRMGIGRTQAASGFAQALGQVSGVQPATSSSGRASSYDSLIQQAATRNGLDAGLLKAVVHAESGFNANAVSRTGAQGLMQLMPSTARALGVTNAFDPAQNIDGGARYLRHLMDQFGDSTLAVAAYNAGPGSVERYGGVPPFTETQNYVRQVQAYWKQDVGR